MHISIIYSIYTILIYVYFHAIYRWSAFTDSIYCNYIFLCIDVINKYALIKRVIYYKYSDLFTVQNLFTYAIL